MGMLDGKAAIITGSGRGIGSATARLLGEQGASVVVSDLDPVPAEELPVPFGMQAAKLLSSSAM